MRIQVSNVLRVREADLVLKQGTISAVSGDNSVGKTSLATAIGGALSFEKNPLSGSKGTGSVYLHDGADAGFVAVSDDNGEPIVRWQAASGDLTHFDTEAAISSPAVVGLVDFTSQLSAPARTALWEEYFLPPPNKLLTQIKKALLPHLRESVLEDVLKMIRRANTVDQGISVVAKTFADRGRTEKREWTKVTGVQYGKAKAADWLPHGWMADFDGLTLPDLDEAIASAQDDLHGMQIGQAVAASDIERAKEAKAKIADTKTAITQAEAQEEGALKKLRKEGQEYHRLQKEVETLMDSESAMSKPAEVNHYTCPHCQGLVAMTRLQGLIKYDKSLHETAMQDWEAAKAALKKKIRDTAAQRDAELKRITSFRLARAAAKDKVESLVSQLRMYEAQAQDADAQAEDEDLYKKVDEQTAKIEELQRDRRLIKARIEAQNHHQNVVQYTTIAEILGPKGVRATALEKAMSTVDDILGRIADITGWERVQIQKDYSIAIGKRTFLKVAGDSNRYKAQYALQIAIAWKKREPFVILDKVDVLDTDSREALWTLMNTIAGAPNGPGFLVCGTQLEIRLRNALGYCYLLEDGVLKPLLTEE